MRLYFDEDSMARALAMAARRAGFDVLTTTEAGMEGQDDEDQLAFATREQRIVVTANRRDYARLNAAWLRANRSHAGIVIRNKQRQDIGFVLRAFEAIRRRGDDSTNLFEFI